MSAMPFIFGPFLTPTLGVGDGVETLLATLLALLIAPGRLPATLGDRPLFGDDGLRDAISCLDELRDAISCFEGRLKVASLVAGLLDLWTSAWRSSSVLATGLPGSNCSDGGPKKKI